MPKLSDVQAGRIGEYLLSVYAMLTTEGVFVPFSVVADDDHRDLVIAAKGKGAFASLTVSNRNQECRAAAARHY